MRFHYLEKLKVFLYLTTVDRVLGSSKGVSTKIVEWDSGV